MSAHLYRVYIAMSVDLDPMTLASQDSDDWIPQPLTRRVGIEVYALDADNAAERITDAINRLIQDQDSYPNSEG